MARYSPGIASADGLKETGHRRTPLDGRRTPLDTAGRPQDVI